MEHGLHTHRRLAISHPSADSFGVHHPSWVEAVTERSSMSPTRLGYKRRVTPDIVSTLKRVVFTAKRGI